MKPNFRYDSRYNSEYKQRIQELVEYVLNKNYGDTISFEKACYLLKYNFDNEKEYKKFKSTMARVKNILIDYGYVLKTITNVGYYILKPKQISGYCYHTYVRRTENLLEKSSRILAHIETINLSEDRKEEYDNMCDLNADLIENIAGTIDVSKYIARKSYYDSIED